MLRGESGPDADVHVLDLGYLGLRHAIAAFLVIGPRGPVLVETGPASTLPGLEAGLAAHGFSVESLRGALVTHIHLDHSGAAGHLASRGVPIFVHPRGLPHLVDPSRLLASAGRIYGDRLEGLWGLTIAAPDDMVTPLDDNESVEIGGLRFTAIDTPGHARHHHAYRLGGRAFCGDIAGVRLPGSDLIAVPAVPPEFDQAAWRGSIERLAGGAFDTLFLTHFGAVTAPSEHLHRLRTELDEIVDFVGTLHRAGREQSEITSRYVEWSRERARARGVTGAELERFEAANPFEVSVGGIIRALASGPARNPGLLVSLPASGNRGDGTRPRSKIREMTMTQANVREIMTTDVISISRDLKVDIAIETMRANNIRRLPVLSSTDRLIGIITIDQAQLAMPRGSSFYAARSDDEMPTINEVMTDYVYTIEPDVPVGMAARKMVDHQIGALPVLDDEKKIIGIVTESDLFRYLAAEMDGETEAASS